MRRTAGGYQVAERPRAPPRREGRAREQAVEGAQGGASPRPRRDPAAWSEAPEVRRRRGRAVGPAGPPERRGELEAGAPQEVPRGEHAGAGPHGAAPALPGRRRTGRGERGEKAGQPWEAELGISRAR